MVFAVAAFALFVGSAGVYGAQSQSSMVAAAAGGGTCEPKFKQCMQQDVPKKKKTAAQCEQEFQKCVLQDNKCKDKTGISGGQTCNKAPDCQTHCTESATGKGAILDCCKGGAKHVNSCPDEVDGKCNPQKKELGKEGGQKGGEPKMPELPKPPESKDGGGGQPQQQPCGTDSKIPGAAPAEGGEKRKDCPPETKSGISNLFDMFSSSGEGGGSSQRDTVSSALSKISSFFGGSQNSAESATGDEKTTPSGASNTGGATDVSSAVSRLSAQEPTQSQSESDRGGNAQQNSLTTGFTNSGAGQGSAQSTTILSSLVTRLKAALSWLSGL
jgi:hypothetical protein